MASKVLKFIAATAVSALSIAPVWVLFSFYARGMYYFSSIDGLTQGFYFLLVAVAFASIVIVLFGLPLHMYLRKTNRLNAMIYGVVGSLLPTLFLAFAGVIARDTGVIQFSFGLSGLIASLTFRHMCVNVYAI